MPLSLMRTPRHAKVAMETGDAQLPGPFQEHGDLQDLGLATLGGDDRHRRLARLEGLCVGVNQPRGEGSHVPGHFLGWIWIVFR